MAETKKKRRSVQVPLYLVVLVPLMTVLLGMWAFALAYDRNPLPFPDHDYQVFSASSVDALVAMEDVMISLGQRPRFRADSPNVQRTIFASGTGESGRICHGRAKTRRLTSVRPAHRPAKSKSITAHL